jgi:hypothetical protein
MTMRMDGWKVSYDGIRARVLHGPCWAVLTYFRAYGGRDVPDSFVIESLHKDRPNLERLIEKYQYPAPGSIKLYDFAYRRMASSVAYREAIAAVVTQPVGYADSNDSGICYEDAEEQPGVEKVYRKVDVIRLTDREMRDLYLDWARTRVLQEIESPSLDFALHVLADLGGEVH